MRSFLFLPFLLFQCTTVGFHEEKIRNSIDFGSLREFKVCTFFEEGITPSEIDDLFVHWNEELSLYSLRAVIIDPKKMDRPGFTGTDILNFLHTLPLEKPCDRILYLKGRNWKDLVYEFFTLGILAGIGVKLEMQGGVETYTNTRGYIKAKYISTLQLLFTSPKSTLVHEGYHLLGCGHQLFMQSCYEQIQTLKNLANSQVGEDFFFPSHTKAGERFLKRSQVNDFFGTRND
jgi:hypothetical protein